MSTQQQIDDPGQWRVGDDVRIEWPNGAALTGKAEECGGSLALVIGDCTRYHLGYHADRRKVTVTRTVEPIPEPTEPWALVRFADGEIAARIDGSQDKWFSRTLGWDAWETYGRAFGAPVAVSLPHWSDEVDGLRADGAALIAAERKRQIEVEGYTEKHDAGHASELATAASAYALNDFNLWPWSAVYWKPGTDRKRTLVKAGALIAAALDALLVEGGEA